MGKSASSDAPVNARPSQGDIAEASGSQTLWTRRNTPEVLVPPAVVSLVVGAWVPPSSALAILLTALALAAAFDLRTGLIPNALTLAATALALAAWMSPPLALAPPAAALTAASALALLRLGSVVWLGAPGFGWGDVKLVVPLGLVLGWSVLWALYLAVVLAALVAIVGLLTGQLSRHSRIPFAPFILGGTLLHFVLPVEAVLDWIAALTL